MKKLFLFLFLFNFYKIDSMYNFSKNYLNKASDYLFRNKFKSLGLGIISIYLGYKIFSGYKKSSKNDEKKFLVNFNKNGNCIETEESKLEKVKNFQKIFLEKTEDFKNELNDKNMKKFNLFFNSFYSTF